MKANAFKAKLGIRAQRFAISSFVASATCLFLFGLNTAQAQAPGTPDKNKPTIPLSPAPSFGPKPAAAPAAADKPSAPAAAPAVAPKADASKSDSSKPDASKADTSKAADKPAAQSSSAAVAAPATAPSLAKPAAAAATATGAKMLTTAGGVKYQDTTVGNGAVAAKGQTVSVHYTGWLLEGGKLGRKFDSSLDRGQPFQFPLGGNRVIKGWDEGVVGMKVGGTRVLTIPPEMGYGARGAGGVIPPGATLVFEVKLLGV